MRHLIEMTLAAMLAMFGSPALGEDGVNAEPDTGRNQAADSGELKPRFCTFLQQGYKKGGDVVVICRLFDLQVDLTPATPARSPELDTVRTGKAGDLLYRETASFTSRSIRLVNDVTVDHRSIQLVIPAGTELEVFKVGGGFAFCRFVGEAGKGKRKSPEVHCLFDTNADGYIDQFKMRKKNIRRLIRKTNVEPVRYEFVGEPSELARIVERSRKKKMERGVRLVSLTPSEAVLEIPVLPTEFGPDGAPVDDTSAFARKLFSQDDRFTVPLSDGVGTLTHKGMTLEIQHSDGDRITYRVTSGFSPWYQ